MTDVVDGALPGDVARRKLAAFFTHSAGDWIDELECRRRTRTAD